MDQHAKIFIIVGVVLSVLGIVILVLQFTTSVFKKDTLISAGTAVTDGMAVAQSAFITWDETSIVTDASNNIVKWASTTQFTDSSTGLPYTYDIVPCAYSPINYTLNIPVPATTNGTTLAYSNSGLKAISTSATTYLGRVASTTQSWNSYPQLNEPHTVYIVGKTATGVSTSGTGGLLSYTSTGDTSKPLTQILIRLQSYTRDIITVDMSGYYTTNPIPILKYANSSGTQVASCIFGYEYSGGTYCGTSLCVDTAKLTTRLFQTSPTGSSEFTSLKPTFGANIRSGQPYVSINRDYFPTSGVASTIYCILVFKSVLTDAQRTSLFAYLNDKYFKPEMVYPKTFIGTAGSALTVPIVNGATHVGDPVTYTIQPTLPTGLSFTDGSITGTPTSIVPALDYTITAANSVISNTSVINIAIDAKKKITSSPPNIMYTVPSLTLNQVVSLQPSNTGESVSKFTISPANITELTGLTFDTTTGILSGTVTTSAKITITITATNDSGTSDSQFALKTGNIIEYASTSIDSTIDQPIQILRLKILSGEIASVKSLTYTGDLFGLSFNTTTGDISGTPTRIGTSNVTVTAIFSDGSTTSTELSVRVLKRVKASVNPGIIIGAGSGATAVGVGLISYGTYVELSSNKM